MGDAAFDLSFSVEHRFRPFALVAPAEGGVAGSLPPSSWSLVLLA